MKMIEFSTMMNTNSGENGNQTILNSVTYININTFTRVVNEVSKDSIIAKLKINLKFSCIKCQ